MNHKRRKPRSQVRCQLCTADRRNIGGDRQQREHDARAPSSVRVSNGQFWDWCPDCGAFIITGFPREGSSEEPSGVTDASLVGTVPSLIRRRGMSHVRDWLFGFTPEKAADKEKPDEVQNPRSADA